MNDKFWWKIRVNHDDEFTDVYFYAKDILTNTTFSIIVDGLDVVFEETIRFITRIEHISHPDVLFHIFKNYIKYEQNDKSTRARVETYLPNTICNDELNPSDIIRDNSIRFKVGHQIIEFNPNNLFNFTWI